MMKTLCAAVVLLSLASLCQSASLACENLLKPADKGPDLSGSWYLIVMSAEKCLVAALMNSLVSLSIKVDFTPKDTPNIYDTNSNFKIYGYCTTESDTTFYENNTFYDFDSNNAPTGKPHVLLHSGCSDCMVLKVDGVFDTFMLLSRRKAITPAELKEFEMQTECLGWSNPYVLSSDHDYENCQSIDNDDVDIDTSGLSRLIFQRLKKFYREPLKCLADNFLYYPRLAFEWVQQFL